jgi:hypothetical protein
MNVYLVSSPEGKLTHHEAFEPDIALREAVGDGLVCPGDGYGYGWTVYQIPVITVKEPDEWRYMDID